MKKIFLAAVLLVSVFGFMSVIRAMANAEHNQTLLDDALKAVRAAPAAQLTDRERAALVCRGKFHSCFQLTNAEMEEVLSTVGSFFDCDNICSGVNSPGCSNQACVNRCWAASGNSGVTQCEL
jgi:hypothetical protein